MTHSLTRRHTLALLAAGAYAPSAAIAEGAAQGIPTPGAEIVLELSDGKSTFRAEQLRGKWALVFFGYMSCPDVCPMTLFDIARVLRLLGTSADKVVAVFISVDPERDDVTRLRDYVSSFDARIVALSGPAERIAKSAASFGVSYYKISGATPTDYTIAHSAFISLVGPEGGILGRYSTETAPEEFVSKLRKLI